MSTNARSMRQSETAKPPLVITSDDQFEALMEDIDREMIAEGVGIPARPLAAGCKITGRYDVVLNGIPGDRPIIPGVFSPDQISLRIHDWMNKRYGDRLKLSFTLGTVAIQLRGSVYVIKCPVILGSARFVCEPGTFGHPRETLGVRSVPICNTIDLVEGMTADLARSLTAEEVVKLGLAHISAMGAYVSLQVVGDVQFVNEALGDLDAAVGHLVEHNPQPGLSKWASFQAAEKLLKAYIITKDKTVEVKKISHKLDELVATAVGLGFPPVPSEYIRNIKCPAGVRYGEVSVSIEEAGIAHLISLEICEVAAQSIGMALKRDVPKIPEAMINGMPAREFLRKHAATQ